MAILKIVKYPDPFLEKIAKKVLTKDFNCKLSNIIKNMFDTMYHYDGIGLAATQVKLDMQMFVLDQKKPLVVINPEIVEKSGISLEEEGCLSIPGIYPKVRRAEVIAINYKDEKNKLCYLKTDGYLSRCIQHEIDHLNGITFFSHLSSLKNSILKIKYRKYLLRNDF